MVSLLFLAVALGLDAFSVCLGIGMQRIRLKRMAEIGIVIGLFHLFMPFLGILTGKLLLGPVGEWAEMGGGLLLAGIGFHMFFQAFQKEEENFLKTVGVGLWVLGFSVSIDSFSVGLSLGIAGAHLLLALVLFCTVSMVMAWLGLLFGRKVQSFMGAYSEMLGGSILIGFGLYALFG
jgi:putative Mn2+ efflux pump MntP